MILCSVPWFTRHVPKIPESINSTHLMMFMTARLSMGAEGSMTVPAVLLLPVLLLLGLMLSNQCHITRSNRETLN